MSDPLHVEQLIAAIPCRIELPEGWADYFTRSGPLPPSFDDDRRFRRFFLRRPAALRLHPTFPGFQRTARTDRVFLKDICRVSVAFIHSEQLFPRESMELLMADGSVLPATVIRCVRHQKLCYEIAATFKVSGEAAAN